MKCTRCDKQITESKPLPAPHFRLLGCGHRQYETQEEWENSKDHRELEREQAWYAAGGTWETYKQYHSIKSY